MRIQSSEVELNSQHFYQRSESTIQLRQLRVLSEQPERASTKQPDRPPANTPAATVDLSDFRIGPQQALERIEALTEKALLIMDMQTNLLKALVEAMSGKKIESVDFTGDKAEPVTPSRYPVAASVIDENPTVEVVTLNLYQLQEYEYSNVNIAAKLTDDNGDSFEISLQVKRERLYQESSAELSLFQGKLTDPLVINFNGDTARLSNEKVEFDLNADGNAEWIPSLSSDSAYIALDKNGNGLIDDGSELFGPGTGNGFAELAQYDEDGNGFIDEGDSVYQQLLAFRPGDNYQQSLPTLGVAAIFTGSVSSPFSLTDSQNQLLGQVRSSGFYVNDSKLAGSVQQLDLVV